MEPLPGDFVEYTFKGCVFVLLLYQFVPSQHSVFGRSEYAVKTA
jgi:hypothetical protein